MTELREKIAAEITRLNEDVGNTGSWIARNSRAAARQEALRWVLAQIEALPTVGVGEEKGMGSCDSTDEPRSGRSQAAPSPGAVADIAAERRRQIEVEGWAPDHDDEHDRGEILAAAICYAQRRWDERRFGEFITSPPAAWPWSPSWWKPKDTRRDLIRAAALLAAEIDRMDRLTDGGAPSPSTTGPINPDVIPTKTPSPTTPLGAEDLERALVLMQRDAQQEADGCAPGSWGKANALGLVRGLSAARHLLNLPVEPGQ